MGIVVLVDPVAGTTTDATQQAANNAALKAVLNGGVDAANFAAGLVFNPNKIQQAAAAVGQALVWDGAKWAPGSAGITTYRKTTSKQVVNTVAESDLLNGEITVGAGAMGASSVLRLTAYGDWKQNSGAATDIPRLKLKLGATTLIDTGVLAVTSMPNSATRFPWRLVAEIANLGATNVQWATFNGEILMLANATVGGNAIPVGEGFSLTQMFNGGPGAAQVRYIGALGAAVDTTIAQLLSLSVILPVANALTEIILKGALVEIL